MVFTPVRRTEVFPNTLIFFRQALLAGCALFWVSMTYEEALSAQTWRSAQLVVPLGPQRLLQNIRLKKIIGP